MLNVLSMFNWSDVIFFLPIYDNHSMTIIFCVFHFPSLKGRTNPVSTQFSQSNSSQRSQISQQQSLCSEDIVPLDGIIAQPVVITHLFSLL